MVEREMMDNIEEYQLLRDVIRTMEDGGHFKICGGGIETRLEALLPEETVERIRRYVFGELCVHMMELRQGIREILDLDEKEQLNIGQVETINETIAIPKNDYRRQQNSQEDDDGK